MNKINIRFCTALLFSLSCLLTMVNCQHGKPIQSSNNSPIKKYVLPEDALVRVEQYFQSKISSRYMEQNAEPVTYPNWEGFPLMKYKYTAKDKDGTKKPAEVIMLNASPRQLARWVVYTCMEAKGSAEPEYTDKLSKHIIMQSGAQFPVAGMVYEDMEGDGVNKLYCFRDGVTVGIKGIANARSQALSSEEIHQTLYGEITWSGKYARIQSTTREQYISASGKEDVGTSETGKRKLSWLTASRELYQSAWNNDRNELMIAWAKQNL